jgi:hypothetical protein
MKATMEVPLEDKEVSVTFEYHYARPATIYNRHGDPGDPAEGPEVDILDVSEDLTDEEYDTVEDYILENWEAQNE